MTGKGYRGELGEHSKIELGEAALIDILGHSYYPQNYGYGPDKDKKIAKEVNSVWHHNRTGRDIRSLLRHIEECNLTIGDFIDCSN